MSCNSANSFLLYSFSHCFLLCWSQPLHLSSHVPDKSCNVKVEQGFMCPCEHQIKLGKRQGPGGAT